MRNYLIDFQEKKALVIDLSNREAVARIRYPELKDHITLPVSYHVTSIDENTLGVINSYWPERNKIRLRGEKSSSILVIKDGPSILKTEDKRYDIGKLNLEDMVTKDAEALMDMDFSYGYKLRSSAELGELQFFEKENGAIKAILSLGKSSYLNFLPLVMHAKIFHDVSGKEIRKSKPVKTEIMVKRIPSDGPFVKFVKETLKPRILTEAFAYQDQEGEKTRFFEYLDKGIRPVILNGPTGNGKSVLAKDYAYSKQIPFYFNTGNNSFRLSTAIGKFVPSPGNSVFSPGSLTLAAIFGGLYVLEEMPPIIQDELTGLHIFLETGELPVITQFGYEVITAHPDFKLVATGNFHSNYTTNELNDALLQRFAQLKIRYPSKNNTIDILQARAPGLDYETAEIVTDVLFDMRNETKKHSVDLGLKGIVEMVQRMVMGTDISMRELFKDNVINPLTTYKGDAEGRDGKLDSKLMSIVDRYI